MQFNQDSGLTHLTFYSVWTCPTYIRQRVQGEGAAEDAGHENEPSAGHLSRLGLRKQTVEKIRDPEDHGTYLKILAYQLHKTRKTYITVFQLSTLPQSLHFGRPLPLMVFVYYRNKIINQIKLLIGLFFPFQL